MKPKFLLFLIVPAVLVGLVFSVKRIPQPALFCDQCVMEREIVELRLAGRWKVGAVMKDNPTPVSELLAQYHACPAHTHQWSAPIRVAEADLETPDAPRIRSIGFLNAPRTVSFLREVFAYTNERAVSDWHELAWQPAYAAALDSALRFNRYPESGFGKRDAFFAWWNDRSYPLFNKLHDMTVAD